jgi:hypothetical protein
MKMDLKELGEEVEQRLGLRFKELPMLTFLREEREVAGEYSSIGKVVRVKPKVKEDDIKHELVHALYDQRSVYRRNWRDRRFNEMRSKFSDLLKYIPEAELRGLKDLALFSEPFDDELRKEKKLLNEGVTYYFYGRDVLYDNYDFLNQRRAYLQAWDRMRELSMDEKKKELDEISTKLEWYEGVVRYLELFERLVERVGERDAFKLYCGMYPLFFMELLEGLREAREEVVEDNSSKVWWEEV